MGAKWMRVETDFVDHPKVRRLCTVLGNQQGGWFVLRLWSFMSRFCPTGHLRDIDGTSVETECEWTGTPGKLISALAQCEFLDEKKGGGWVVHDWDDHQGRVALKAQKERERKAEYRKKLREVVPQPVPSMSHGTSAGHPAQRDVTGRNVRRVKTAKSDASASTPSLFSEPERSADAGKAPDPNFTPTRAKLEAAFLELRGSEYYFNGQKDGAALSSLLKRSESDEILRRWKLGLQEKKFPIINEIPQLLQHWNSFANLKVEKIPREHQPMRRL